MSCEHGFVVRSASGANRFLCRECNTRFMRYPQKQSWQQRFNRQLRWDALADIIQTSYQSKLVEQLMNNQVTYTFPTTGKVTESYQLIGDDNE